MLGTWRTLREESRSSGENTTESFGGRDDEAETEKVEA